MGMKEKTSSKIWEQSICQQYFHCGFHMLFVWLLIEHDIVLINELFLYVGRVSFEWAKHGGRCQRNTMLINVLYFILRSFEFLRFRIFYYVFKVVLRKPENQWNSIFLNCPILNIALFRKYFPYKLVHWFTM